MNRYAIAFLTYFLLFNCSLVALAQPPVITFDWLSVAGDEDFGLEVHFEDVHPFRSIFGGSGPLTLVQGLPATTN
ncbi:MAG: hypothetical protein AAGA30_06180, partial [Planctomycetota bacterium]